MGGSDEQRPLRRDEAALHRARGFHQLGGEHDVDVARHRHQRQHRRAARRLRGRFRKQFDVIDGGAGALRDARHGGRLGEIPAVLGKIDDPVGKHAAALAAERNHCNGDRPHRGDSRLPFVIHLLECIPLRQPQTRSAPSPPCGGGMGRGVMPLANAGTSISRPPPPAPPHKGEGSIPSARHG